jgi:membrane-bound lytic murein transglycosylase D
MRTLLTFLSPLFLLMLVIHHNTHGQVNHSYSDNEQLIHPVYQFDYTPDFTYDQVAERVKAMNTNMSFTLNDKIFAFVNYFLVRNRNYTRMILERKDIYFPLFEQTLRNHNMPDDIKYLSIIESGLNPKAKSRVGALGLWQFMPATGKMYRLNYDDHIDDRMDPEQSTVAAAKYLKSLYSMFGNWEVALAAYNCGPGNVRKAIRKSGGKTTFWEIYDHLPKETRSYVPQFQAMMYIMKNAENHNLFLEEPTFPIAFEKVTFNQSLDFENLAQVSGMCVEDLEFLNPSIRNKIIPQEHESLAINIPKTKVNHIFANKEQFADAIKVSTFPNANLNLLASSQSTKTTPVVESTASTKSKIVYKVRSGDALGKIAAKHGVSTKDIMRWNNLSSSVIKVGQNLSIYSGTVDTSKNIASSNSGTSNPSSGNYYTVQPGDTLWTISKKLDGITIDEIKKLNNLNSNQIKPGQKLIIG